MSVLTTIIIALLVFGALILIHEFGHFITARIFGVGINEFAIGMGPKILSRKGKKTGTAYSLRLLPIGGFVSMKGEDSDESGPDCFGSKPVWQRMIIVLAGSFMNILLGVVLVTVMVLSTELIGSTVVHSFTEGATSPQYGLLEGDEIIKVGSTRVHTAVELSYEIVHDGTEPIDLTVVRGGERVVLEGVTFPTAVSSGMEIGALDFYVQAAEKTPLTIVKNAFWQSVSYVKMIWESLIDLVGGKYGMEQVSGPVGITKEIGAAAKAGPLNLISLCSVIALNLGIVNLLPLPALDGGRFLFMILELLRGRRIDPKYEGYVHLIGMALLLLLMVVVAFGDVRKLLAGL